jgi:hypothetical protein
MGEPSADGIWTRVPFRWPVREAGKITPFPLPPCPVDARWSRTIAMLRPSSSSSPKRTRTAAEDIVQDAWLRWSCSWSS